MTPAIQPPRATLPFTGSDLLGLSRLGLDAAVGIMNIVESMHHAIASKTGFLGPVPAGRPLGVAGTVYGALRGTTRAASLGLEAMLGGLIGSTGPNASTPEREAAVAALNGLWGDHLVETGNSLAIAMKLRVAGRALNLTGGSLAGQLEAPTGKVLVLVHGLCLNDLQWTRRDGHDHGVALARDLGFAPVYLHYNTGLHVSRNGRDLSELLDRLVAAWPVPVEELVLLGHSMGGLVVRSACHHAERDEQAWLRSMRRMVFLGTPHHGAPLERGGHVVDKLFGVSPYLAPFGSLGKARSAGITDLRFGNVHDDDWQGRNRHDQVHDDRRPVPVPKGVAVYAVAATTSEHPDALGSYLIGDGLVPVASALGSHRDPTLDLGIPVAQRYVATSANHFDLLNREDIHEKLRGWLG
jgi:pimeloyl-ACP methyl ester carboxylesterase